MATLAFSLAGQFVGGLVGGPIGATIGRALGALAGSAVDGVLFGDDKAQGAVSDLRVQGSSEGGAIPRLYGWNRVSGNIIWARELELLDAEGSGAKGFGSDSEDEIGASFAVAFGEGEVQRLGRIWADGQLLDTEGLTLRFYRGSEGQLPDGLIEATQGAGRTPAYRGLCYIVFEQLLLSRFGNRIPQISVELCRVVGDLEPGIRAVTVIPGATEFGYDPVPRVRVVGKGQTLGENSHQSASASDWTLSIDELQALCPNLERVALVVAWFGDDLRCGNCQIGPRVEGASRKIERASWSVAGLGRGDVPVVSSHGGGPAYGGTPSDGAVLAAIADLNARGIAVTLYPIILMDVPESNTLTDPYSGAAGQAAYPWRGRITCYPAPGQGGTPDKTAAVNAQVNAFVSGYRQMVLHYAQLGHDAGGVDALLLGSEMRGVSTLRGAGDSFPFVTALVTLAADVRAIVGSGTKLTYGADWTEYSGYQVDGEKFFHLDPLWASSNIDAVGIDNYLPLADWRDGGDHADAALADSPYELDYLKRNIAAGEGYDWYYASDAARLSGTRTPITDGAYDEPWVWRVKDIRNWWSHAHYDRPGGIRAASPTAWTAGARPIWFTEIGCGAVDKGANQPNVFVDPKSAESGLPYFSSGNADPLMQRQFLRAHQQFWANTANNPVGMVDTGRVYLWTWDARPFPAFPGQTDVWSDGANHATGHWLTGRLGGAANDELVRAIAADHGLSFDDVAVAGPLVQGYQLAGAGTCRAALDPVIKAAGLNLRDTANGLQLVAGGRTASLTVPNDALAEIEKPVLARRRADFGEVIGRMAVSFVDRQHDYATGTVTAMRQGDGALTAEASGLVLDAGGARLAAERLLSQNGQTIETLDFALPPSQAALEPGDLIGVDGRAEGPFLVTEIRDGAVRSVAARSLPNPALVGVMGETPRAASGVNFAKALPVLALAHLPPPVNDPQRSRLAIGAYAQPWPGSVGVTDEATGTSLVNLTRRAGLGETTVAFGAGPIGVWDRANALSVKLYAGHLAAVDPLAALAGGNRLAVQADSGEWEIVGFADAVLIAPQTYRLTNLLRGLDGTGSAVGSVSAGNPVMVVDTRTSILAMDGHWPGTEQALRLYAGSSDLAGTPLTLSTSLQPLLPLAPVHLRALRTPGSNDVALSWVRCSRADGDGWATADAPLEAVPERYAVSIFNGSTLARSLDCSAPVASYSAAQQTADFGTPPGSFAFTIAQVSPVYGAGHVASGEFHG